MTIRKSVKKGQSSSLSLLYTMGLLASVTLGALAIPQSASAQETFRCGNENAVCSLPSTAKHYSTSYGTPDRAVIVETKNLHAIPCSNALGDSHGNVGKSCNAVAVTKETSGPELGFTRCAGENQVCKVPSVPGQYSVVRYGANGHWLYNNVASDVWCANGGFGFWIDPVPNVYKQCEVSTTRHKASNSSWTTCANEGGDCKPRGGFGTYLVRYGADVRWLYRTVVGKGIGCSTGAFGTDPAAGTYKSCQYMGMPTIRDIQGEWEKLSVCGGCGPGNYEFKWGVESEKTRKATSHWTQEVKVGVESGFKIKGIGGTANVEETTTFGESNTVASSFTETAGSTFKHKCDKGALWQLKTTVDEFCRPNSQSCSTVAKTKVLQCAGVNDTPQKNWPTN